MWSVLWVVGCRPIDPVVQPYSGRPLWAEIELDSAVDLGHVAAAIPEAERRPSGSLQFEDVTEAAGLAGALGGGNTHGVGLGLLDLDADGWPDLILANGISNRGAGTFPSVLAFNNGDGTFTDATDASGVGAILGGLDTYSVAAGDVDNDGDVDLYVGAQPTNVLLLNNGDRTFTDGTGPRGAAGSPSDPDQVADGRGKVVGVGDVDGDGWLDLVSASSTHVSPGAVLLHNDGTGHFTDATAASGIEIAGDGNPCAVMFSDYDNDGDADLWIWNDRGGHTLLHNHGGMFESFGSEADGVNIRNPMGIDAADIDHDGDLDYYISNIGDHPLLINRGDGTFVDYTQAAGTAGDFGWGLAFEDLDHDGFADLYVTQEDDRPVLAYRNLGQGTPAFEGVSIDRPSPIADRSAAHNVAAAFADVDGDGLVDAAFATTDGSRLVLHRNRTDPGSHRWLEVRIDATPQTGERGGIGARVAVWTPDGLLQFRDLLGGSSRASVNALSARFGLGDFDGADQVVVLWPDGRQRVFVNVPAGSLVVE